MLLQVSIHSTNPCVPWYFIRQGVKNQQTFMVSYRTRWQVRDLVVSVAWYGTCTSMAFCIGGTRLGVLGVNSQNLRPSFWSDPVKTFKRMHSWFRESRGGGGKLGKSHGASWARKHGPWPEAVRKATCTERVALRVFSGHDPCSLGPDEPRDFQSFCPLLATPEPKNTYICMPTPRRKKITAVVSEESAPRCVILRWTLVDV